MKKYITISLGISIVFIASYFTLNDLLFASYLHPHFPGLVVFFFMQSLAISWMLREGEKDRSRLPLYALGSITFRFVTGILYIVVYLIAEVPNIKSFIIQFMGLYLVYLVFELIVVLANLRRN